jgi:peptidoglycan hydrolase FlgJ
LFFSVTSAISMVKDSMEITSIQLKDMAQTTDKADKVRLEKACKDFEAIILNQMLSAMRKTVPEGGLFEKSYGEKIYQSMSDEELSKNMAHNKGMGLGEMLFKQLTAKK